MRVTFELNGTRRSVETDPDMRLLWLLRDQLGLTGTKYGCGEGICGSCVVLLDGKPARACQLSMKDLQGRKVVTIEGLDPKGQHPVQKLWLEEDVAACGYCQGSMILTAVALLKEKPNPTDRDIDGAFEDVLCRCGTYDRVRRAVKKGRGR